MTAAAGAEAVLLGGVARGEEDDLVPGGSAGRTGRAAVNAGGPHRKDKLPVSIYRALLCELPPLVIGFAYFHLPTRYAGSRNETIRFLRSNSSELTAPGARGSSGQGS